MPPSATDLRFLRENGFQYDADRDTWVGPLTWSAGLFDGLDVVCTCDERPAPPPAPRRAMRARRRQRRKR